MVAGDGNSDVPSHSGVVDETVDGAADDLDLAYGVPGALDRQAGTDLLAQEGVMDQLAAWVADLDELDRIILAGTATDDDLRHFRILSNAIGALRFGASESASGVVDVAEKEPVSSIPLTPEGCLSDPETDGRKYAHAVVIMHPSVQSSEYVHGPDMMVSVTELVMRLLRPANLRRLELFKERLTELKSVVWKEIVTGDLDIHVVEGDVNFRERVDFKDFAVYGQFLTSKGRTLSFFAIQRPETSIAGRQPVENDYFRDSVCGDPEKNIKACSELDKSQPMLVSTMLELVTQAIRQAGRDEFMYRGIPMADGLMALVKNMPIPSRARKVLGPGKEVSVTFHFDSRRVGRKGFSLIDFDCKVNREPRCYSGTVAVDLQEE